MSLASQRAQAEHSTPPSAQDAYDEGYRAGLEDGKRWSQNLATIHGSQRKPSKDLAERAAKHTVNETPCSACSHGQWLHSDEYEPRSKDYSYQGGSLIGRQTGRCTKSGCGCWRFGMSPEEQARLNEAAELDDLLADLAGEPPPHPADVWNMKRSMLNYAAQDAAVTREMSKAMGQALMYGAGMNKVIRALEEVFPDADV